MTRPAQPRRSNPPPAKTPELCVQIRPKIAATAKIKHAESCLTSHKLPNTPRGHNHPTILQEAHIGLQSRSGQPDQPRQYNLSSLEIADSHYSSIWRQRHKRKRDAFLLRYLWRRRAS